VSKIGPKTGEQGCGRTACRAGNPLAETKVLIMVGVIAQPRRGSATPFPTASMPKLASPVSEFADIETN
jgi:hypothetical protein